MIVKQVEWAKEEAVARKMSKSALEYSVIGLPQGRAGDEAGTPGRKVTTATLHRFTRWS